MTKRKEKPTSRSSRRRREDVPAYGVQPRSRFRHAIASPSAADSHIATLLPTDAFPTVNRRRASERAGVREPLFLPRRAHRHRAGRGARLERRGVAVGEAEVRGGDPRACAQPAGGARPRDQVESAGAGHGVAGGPGLVPHLQDDGQLHPAAAERARKEGRRRLHRARLVAGGGTGGRHRGRRGRRPERGRRRRRRRERDRRQRRAGGGDAGRRRRRSRRRRFASSATTPASCW